MYAEKFSHSLIVHKPYCEWGFAQLPPSRRPGEALSKFLTMCGRRILARLWIRAWLNPESSRNRASFCSSMILFSSSMFFRFFSMVEICRARSRAGLPTLPRWHPPPPRQGASSPGSGCTSKHTNLRLQFHHGRFHLRVGLVQLTDLLVQLLDLFIVLQNCREEGRGQSADARRRSKKVGLSAEPILLRRHHHSQSPRLCFYIL